MNQHYADIAAAHFTLVIGGFGVNTPGTVLKQVKLCEKYGLKAIVSRAGLPPTQLPESPAVWGYTIRDEPHARDFPGLQETVATIRKTRPGRLSYINLFPNYASERQLGTKTYDAHVRRFAEEVGVDVLSMDHYPMMRPDHDTRNNYSFAYTAWPTLEFDVPLEQLREVCKETGKEIPIVDNSPAMEGLQISLNSGEGRLFLLPAE